jgi:Zn-dependent metalloprotease
LGLTATPVQAGRSFLETYGKLFGLQDPAGELTLMSERALNNGRAFVRFQQVYQDIPIFGGELITQSDGKHNIISASGGGALAICSSLGAV